MRGLDDECVRERLAFSEKRSQLNESFSYFFMQNIGQVNFAMKYYCDLNAAHSKMGKSIQLSTLCKATQLCLS